MAELETPEAEGYDDSPRGQQRRWEMELQAAEDEVRKWHEQGRRIVARFRDERDDTNLHATRWNLFTSSTQTRRAMMYGKTPATSVSRRFADAQDDVARVGAEMAQRILNADIERDGDGFQSAIGHALSDRELPGLGVARVRYVVEFEDVQEQAAQLDPATGVELAPPIPATQRKSWEDVETDYIYWEDYRWSPGARVPSERRWEAYRNQMSKKKLVERFGKEKAAHIPLNTQQTDGTSSKDPNPWARADVWEIWCKEEKKVYWVVRGCREVLDVKDDPLGLSGFFPTGEVMRANATTNTLVPRPDFVLTQDLYDEIDEVSSRITLLEKAIKVVGVYNKEAAPELSSILTGTGNKMVPAANFASLAEKGGLKGVVDWFPLEHIVAAIAILRDYRRELVDAVYQVSGDSDIMRGQATNANETATAQGLKAKFGSVRMQARQDEFAKFASSLQKLRAEVMAKHFDAQTLIERSNILQTQDAQHAQAAAEFFKSKNAMLRIEVKPEAISLQDFAALKQERTEVITAIATYFSAAQPVAAGMPDSLPHLLEILKWMVAGLRGASSIEATLDQAIAKAQQAASQPKPAPPPDPKLLAVQLKAQSDLVKVDKELQADLVRSQADVQADEQKQRNQAIWNTREAEVKQQIGMVGRTLNPEGKGGLR